MPRLGINSIVQPTLALITGAAGGMGAASATQLAALGWPLLLCDISEARLEQVAGPLRATGVSVEILAGDIADEQFIENLVKALGDRQLGAVIHTAGMSPTQGDAARIMAVNYDATARLVEVVRPRMVEGACAVLIASSSGYLMSAPEYDAALDAMAPGDDSSALLAIAPSAGAAYALSKRGVHRMVERQAAAFGARGTRIMSISPGLIDTAMSRAEQKDSPQMAMMLSKSPLARYGTADEIASVAVFLCSPGASFVTGSDIKVDGGVLAATRS